MSFLTNIKNKNIFVLALISVVASILFSIFGAPFLRVLFQSSKSKVFWITALLLVGSLLIAGATNYKISETAVYVGAIWMTLGIYSELEKRGINWRRASAASLTTGLLFALAGYFLILKRLSTTNVLTEITEPLRVALSQAFPNSQFHEGSIEQLVPGILVGGLIVALFLSFVFEIKIAKLFGIKRERIASGLRWLEFRLPDSIIWVSLSALLFFEVKIIPEWLEIIRVNLVIICAVAFFFQGVAVVEFMVRYYRFGLFMRTLTYILITLQLAPFIVLLGFVDYWADFRKLVRKKIKQFN